MRRFALVIGSVFILSGLTAGAVAGVSPGGTFTDDNGNIHEGYIEAIAAEGITTGCGPALYCPGLDVTRGQMASFIARALNLPGPTRDWFPDDTGLVHEDNINRIADAGITTGFPDGTYRPFDAVRRDQMASFLARALKLPASTADHFTDDNGLVHEENINRIADADVTKGCGLGLYCPGQNVRRDQMASFLGRALGLTPIIPPPLPGTLYSGPVEPMPGFTGTLVFELATDGREVRNPTLHYNLNDYECDGVTVSVTGGQMGVTTSIPVVGGSFALATPTFALSGSFESPTAASGTISGTRLSSTQCPWGPLAWTATSTGPPPPTSSTSTSMSTTTTTLPGGEWPPCDFAPFTISGSGSEVRSFQIPGDNPAVLDITYSGDDLLSIATLDEHQEWIDVALVGDFGGGYQGTRPINHHAYDGRVRFLDIEVDAGAWEIEALPICAARSMTGNSISGSGDEVVLVSRSGTASVTSVGDHNFILWSHQSFTSRDLEVNVIGDFSGQVAIDAGTIFLDIVTGLEPGQWSITFP